MRKFLKVSLLVALFCALMQVAFTSCSDSDDPKPAPAPEPANIPQYLFIYVKMNQARIFLTLRLQVISLENLKET